MLMPKKKKILRNFFRFKNVQLKQYVILNGNLNQKEKKNVIKDNIWIIDKIRGSTVNLSTLSMLHTLNLIAVLLS